MKHAWFALAAAALCIGVAAAAQEKKPDQPQNPFDVEAKEYLGTPQSEAAVKRGLAFLAEHQSSDGHWDSGIYRNDAAVSGLCTLAFLSAGNQPGRGQYGTALEKAANYLVDSVQRNGLVGRGGSAGPPMYGHGFATLALAELYGMTHRADFRPKLEDAVQLILSTQNAEGGWRYQPTVADADISVTAVQVMALRAAANAGIKVPEETVKKAIGYIKRCDNNGPDGGFSYQTTQRGAGPARTGAAITCLILSGERSSPECQRGISYLQHHTLATDEWQYRQHYAYAIYYCTQAMYQVGGQAWKDWFTNIRDRLIREQYSDGSWQESPGTGHEYATAMSILALQVPAGLLPIYQK